MPNVQSEIIFNRLLTLSLEQGAADLILFPGQKPFIRKDGELKNITSEQILTSSFIEEVSAGLLDQTQKDVLKKEQQIIFSRELNNKQRIKINIFKQQGTFVLSIKLIPNKILNLDALNLPKVINELAVSNRGLIVISGPKDSGRTTLLASMIDYINKNKVKCISTIERPVEYLFIGGKSLVEQREVGRDVIDFQAGLASIKSRNVDVLVVSEVDGPASFLEALEIAQKGVLVFVIMDIESSFNVVKQMIEGVSPDKQGLMRLLLGENLGGIICTRLVPRLGGGRILAIEILHGSPTTKAFIKDGKIQQIHNILQITEKEFSVSLDRFLANLVKAEEISVEEAIKYCINEDSLRSFIGRTIRDNEYTQ